ncbi:hypothetical protein CK203_115703 [Vitis vinifera]|uniref:Uncharacterized protein n=1 Tax=Vitis vinifera TaxID=29760 RepID=A0A438CA42_VITVI|nr:hypothetical protein CK203_115703 [Vitis vinifera]
MLNSLNKQLEVAKGKWVDELPSILWVYRTTSRRPTRVTPFALTYGMEVVIPIEIGLPTLFDHQSNPRLRRVLWNPWQGTGRPDTPSECCVSCGRLSFSSGQHIRIGYAIVRNPDGAVPPLFHPDVLHSEFCSAAIPPGCLTSGILLRRHSNRMSHIRHTPHPDILHPAPDAGWERRAFQLPRSDISKSSDSAYPESFADILHSVAVFS